jgi:hypothetical protein
MCEPGRESPVVAETSSAMPIGSADRWPMTTNAVARVPPEVSGSTQSRRDGDGAGGPRREGQADATSRREVSAVIAVAPAHAMRRPAPWNSTAPVG